MAKELDKILCENHTSGNLGHIHQNPFSRLTFYVVVTLAISKRYITLPLHSSPVEGFSNMLALTSFLSFNKKFISQLAYQKGPVDNTYDLRQ